jgi:cytochrome c oxidase assembly protein subunit 15
VLRAHSVITVTAAAAAQEYTVPMAHPQAGFFEGARRPVAGHDPGSGIDRRRSHLRIWLYGGATLTFLLLVIGGITRLTQSGLSIVDWKPLMGVVPPLGEAEWRDAFARYQAYPEYQQLRRGMTLAEFRFIYFWEYLHRLTARLLGLAFVVPFAVFWMRGYFDRPLLRRVLVLFGLGALQGFMGWFMVRSGLVDDPRVSHYRLAAHLSLALVIFGYCLWLARDLAPRERSPAAAHPRPEAARWAYALGALLGVQIVWGAFVAGLDAGTIFNSFPEMGGQLVPPGAWSLDPALRNAVENPATVQWIHRVLGTVLLLAAGAWVVRSGRVGGDARSILLGRLFAAVVGVQYGLGVLTLLHAVPVSLGVLHQATAVVLLGVWLLWMHRLHGGGATAGRSAASAAVS